MYNPLITTGTCSPRAEGRELEKGWGLLPARFRLSGRLFVKEMGRGRENFCSDFT